MLDIRIACTDNGMPTQTTIKDFKIYLNDVNDAPFNLTLSNSTINENAPTGAKVGQFSGMDEDLYQTLTFSLVNNSSYFYIDNENNLRKKGNFSTTKYLYKVLVKAEDNGSPSMEVRILVNHRPKTKYYTTQKMKFSAENFFSKCDQTAILVTFIEEVLHEKLHFLYRVIEKIFGISLIMCSALLSLKF